MPSLKYLFTFPKLFRYWNCKEPHNYLPLWSYLSYIEQDLFLQRLYPLEPKPGTNFVGCLQLIQLVRPSLVAFFAGVGGETSGITSLRLIFWVMILLELVLAREL